MNILDETERERLFKSIETSYKAMDPFRNLTRRLVEQYAGSGYGDSKQREVMINLTNQTIDAYTMSLVANRPRTMVTTRQQPLTYFAKQYELAVNHLIEEIGLEYTLRQWVMDAFFCVGIIKVHMADSGLIQLEPDTWMDPGQPFASNIALDNFVFDASATKWSEVKFAGDAYRVCYYELANMGFDPEIIEQLKPTSKYNVDHDRLDQISKGSVVDPDEFEPMIDLIDVWIPKDGMIHTFAIKDKRAMQLNRTAPLASMPWSGPEGGPYHLLGFNDVPENIMPTSPALHLESLNRLINNIMRKQRNRANAAKNIHLYTPEGSDDAARIQQGSDDQFIKKEAQSDIDTVKIGGVDLEMEHFRLALMDMYDRMAGNLTAMLGLGAQADTVGQEQLIHSAASKKEAQMQYRVVDGSTRIIRDLGKMLWEDQFKTIPGRLPIEGAQGYSIDASWTPGDREGQFEDYDFEVDVYSLPYRSPASVVQSINGVVDRLSAMSPLLQAQGGSINMQKLVDLYSDLLNIPQLKSVVDFTAPLQEPQGESHEKKMIPPTTRTSIRKSVSAGPSSQNKGLVQQQALASMIASKKSA